MANDGQNTWTWDNRSLWTDTRLLGDPSNLNDYKGPAFLLPAQDLLFVSAQGDVLEYRNALAGLSITQLMAMRQPCFGLNGPSPPACVGFAPTASNTTHLKPTLFNTNLYIHPKDTDASTINDDTYGFAWCGRRDVLNLPFDDASYFALGPHKTTFSLFSSSSELIQKLGVGGFITGGFSSNSSYYEVYVASG
jgi:hypothetical protein